MIRETFAPQHHAIAIGGHACAMRPAQQRMNGLAHDLPCQIPKRDIHPRERLHRHPLLAMIAHQIIDLVPNHVALKGAHP